MKTKFYLLMLLLAASFGQVFGASPTSLTFSTKYNSNITLGGTEIKLDDNVSVTFTANKGTAPQYYTKGSSVRAYAKNQITIRPKNGVTITGITLTFGSSDGSNEITASSGTWTSPSWTGTSTSAVVLTIGGTSGHRRIAGVSITYSSGSKYTVVIASTHLSARNHLSINRFYSIYFYFTMSKIILEDFPSFVSLRQTNGRMLIYNFTITRSTTLPLAT